MRKTMEQIKAMTKDEVLEVAKHYASLNGYEVLEVKDLPHPLDCYLKYVMGYSEKKKEYASWLLNVEMGGLHYGHYYSHYLVFNMTKEKAYELCKKDFYER